MGFRKRMRVGLVMALALVMSQLGGLWAAADGAPTMQLVISQFKVTSSDGQFFTLYNPGSTSVDLSNYELEYFNNNDLTKATSSKIISFSGTLAPQSYYMVSDGAAVICYQLTVATASLGFSTTSGFVELLQLPPANPGSLIMPTISDYASWSKTTAKVNGVSNDVLGVAAPAANVTVPSGTSISWYRKLAPGQLSQSIWQPVRPDPANACNLQLVQSGASVTPTGSSTGSLLTNGPEPPATIISLAGDASAAASASLPASDIGLAAPKITELLPNPDGTGNDGADEFIELYNSNALPFDLSGFTLQTGSTTKHSYVFPDGTLLAPKSFTAFYSRDTGLSLSNTSGQADLLDPLGSTLSTTDVYGTAKDGESWALANGKWYWTSQPTPGVANIVKQTAASKSKAGSKKKSGASSSAGAVKGASTTAGSANTADDPADAPAPTHPLILAVVIALAVGYGVYEYRHDIANKLYELRRNRRLGRPARG